MDSTGIAAIQHHGTTALSTAKQSQAESLRDRLNAPSVIRTPDEMQKTATEFEAVFIAQMLSHMFKDVNMGEGLYGPSNASEIYKSMQVDSFGQAIAESGGVGVGDHVMTEMLKLQEVDHHDQ